MSPRPRKAGSLDLPVNLYAKDDKRSGKTYYQYRDPWSEIQIPPAKLCRLPGYFGNAGCLLCSRQELRV